MTTNCRKCGKPILGYAEVDSSGQSWYCGNCGQDLSEHDDELDREADLPDLTFDEDDTPAVYDLLEDIGFF